MSVKRTFDPDSTSEWERERNAHGIPSCRTCRWAWDWHCHRYPATRVGEDINGEGIWLLPPVNPDDGCGEHQEAFLP